MKFDSKKHHRHSIRIKEHDYTQPGGYFVTIVTYQRDCLFGNIVNEEMLLSPFGRIADECWRAIPEHFPNVELDAYVIMPNHIHGIIVINNRTGTIYRARTEKFGKPVIGSIPTILRTFKAAVTRRIGHKLNVTSIWQRNYYEHVIRSHEGWDRIHKYIESNPSTGMEDEENPRKHVEG